MKFILKTNLETLGNGKEEIVNVYSRLEDAEEKLKNDYNAIRNNVMDDEIILEEEFNKDYYYIVIGVLEDEEEINAIYEGKIIINK